MKTLSESMNLKHGDFEAEGAYVIKNVNLGIDAHGTLCLICSELEIDLKNITDSDFDSCGMILDDFCKGCNPDTGYTVSVWFDRD